MDHSRSRSEQKRLAQGLEDLATELIALSAADIKRLPCDDLLKQDIRSASQMQAGARRRQIKFIAKQIRQADYEPLFSFLAQHKGSKLQQNKLFHELERLRDAIITEALHAGQHQASRHEERAPEPDWQSIATAALQFPDLDQVAVRIAAQRYATSRKPVYSREIFRLLHSAMEQGQFRQ